MVDDSQVTTLGDNSSAQKSSLGAKLRSTIQSTKEAIDGWEKRQPADWSAEAGWNVRAERDRNIVVITAENSGSMPTPFIVHDVSVRGTVGKPLTVTVHYLSEYRVNPGEVVAVRVEITKRDGGEPLLDETFTLTLKQLLEGIGHKERPVQFRDWTWGPYEPVTEEAHE